MKTKVLFLALLLLASPAAWGADATINNFTAAGAAAGADLIPTSQSGAPSTTLKQTLTAIATWLWGTVSGDITCSSGGACTIGTNAVTPAKFHQGTANTLLGNPTGSTANEQDITLGTPNLAFSGTTLTTTAPINAQTGTSYTVLTGDNTKVVTFSNSSAVAVTLPQAGSAGFASGWSACFVNLNTGVVTITTTTSTINGNGQVEALSQGASACLASDGTNWEGLISLAQVPGNSGGIPYYSAGHQMGTSSALTANAPVIGGGAGTAPSSGTRSGNTTQFGTTSGTLTSGNLTKFDASGNIIDSGISGADTNIAYTDANQTFTKAQRASVTTDSISTATFTPSFDASNNHSFTLVHASCPCTIANPSTTPVAGQTGMFLIIQSATGSDTVGTWGSQYEYAGGTSAITLSTAANTVDAIPYYVLDSTHIILGGIVKGPAH